MLKKSTAFAIMPFLALFSILLLASCSAEKKQEHSEFERENEINKIKAEMDSSGKTPELRQDLIEEIDKYLLFKSKEQSIRPGNEPFILEGDGETGILLFHGFSASPHEVEELAYFLHKELNATVYAPLIACHGGDYRKFGDCTYEDWIKSAEEAYDDIVHMSDKAYLAGVSLGGNIALDLATRHEASGVITIGAPIQFNDPYIKYISIAYIFFNTLPNKRLTEEDKKYYYYERSIKAVDEMYKFVNKNKEDLKAVTEPILILQSDNDVSVNPASAFYIYYAVGSGKKTIVPFHSESHIIINTEDKERIFNGIIMFIREESIS